MKQKKTKANVNRMQHKTSNNINNQQVGRISHGIVWICVGRTQKIHTTTITNIFSTVAITAKKMGM